MLIYKIFRQAEWQALCTNGATEGAPVDIADGFVHFSTAAQVEETARRHFTGEGDLVLVAVNADALGDALRWESSRGGQLFPHLYRPLRNTDITWHHPLKASPAGHIFPESLE